MGNVQTAFPRPLTFVFIEEKSAPEGLAELDKPVLFDWHVRLRGGLDGRLLRTRQYPRCDRDASAADDGAEAGQEDKKSSVLPVLEDVRMESAGEIPAGFKFLEHGVSLLRQMARALLLVPPPTKAVYVTKHRRSLRMNHKLRTLRAR